MAATPFPTDPKLTAIALAYRNPDIALIADEVLPRTPTAQEFKWLKYDLAQGFTVPDAHVGRKGVPSEVQFSASEEVSRVQDWGLDDVVPNEDIQADNQGVDPLGTAAAYLTNLLNLGREQRVAALVFNPDTYASGKVAQLGGAAQWSHKDADPVAAIGDALDVPVMRPNVAVFGQETWTRLRRNVKLVQAIKGTAQGAGQVSRQEFAEFFELQQVLVGAGWVNQARKGQDVAMQRVWGRHAAFIYRDRVAGPQAGVTFGFTAQWGSKFAALLEEPRVGLGGAVRLRCGERLREVVCARDLGYFFQNAVA